MVHGKSVTGRSTQRGACSETDTYMCHCGVGSQRSKLFTSPFPASLWRPLCYVFVLQVFGFDPTIRPDSIPALFGSDSPEYQSRFKFMQVSELEGSSKRGSVLRSAWWKCCLTGFAAVRTRMRQLRSVKVQSK